MPQPVPPHSVQAWLETAAQGYLLGTEFGHLPGDREPEAVLNDPVLHEAALDATVQLAVFEEAGLEASAALVGLAPDAETRCALATQVLDEARHVEVFRQRLVDLGVARARVPDEVASRVRPALVRLGELLREPVASSDFLAGVVAQNVFMEGLAGPVLELLRAANEGVNPKFARTLHGVLEDESRHARLGDDLARRLLAEAPARRRRALRGLQQALSESMLTAFREVFRSLPDAPARQRLAAEARERARARGVPIPTWHGRELADLGPRELEARLVEDILGTWQTRLARVGLAGGRGR